MILTDTHYKVSHSLNSWACVKRNEYPEAAQLEMQTRKLVLRTLRCWNLEPEPQFILTLTKPEPLSGSGSRVGYGALLPMECEPTA